MQNILITAVIVAIMGSSALLVFYHGRDDLVSQTTHLVSESSIQKMAPLQPAVKPLMDLKIRYSYNGHEPRYINHNQNINSLRKDETILPVNNSWENSYICLHFPTGSCPQDISIVSYGDFQPQLP